MSFFYEFDEVEVFATGAIGAPGNRTFFMQIGVTDQLLTVKCEKLQVATIAQYLRNILSDLPEIIVATGMGNLVSTPIEHDFVLGTVGLGMDRPANRLILQLEEMPQPALSDELEDDLFEEMFGELDLDEDDEDEDEDDDHDDHDLGRLRVFITPAQAVAFCNQVDTLVVAGREPCQWCGAPKDTSGHACPRLN
ncbi:MAG: DUF3090 family protein [Ilumatobacteraceae bacterium]|nr:DUF3090 family protein [Ilumatobacteraceae bacterium]